MNKRYFHRERAWLLNNYFFSLFDNSQTLKFSWQNLFQMQHIPYGKLAVFLYQKDFRKQHPTYSKTASQIIGFKGCCSLKFMVNCKAKFSLKPGSFGCCRWRKFLGMAFATCMHQSRTLGSYTSAHMSTWSPRLQSKPIPISLVSLHSHAALDQQEFWRSCQDQLSHPISYRTAMLHISYTCPFRILAHSLVTRAGFPHFATWAVYKTQFIADTKSRNNE